MGCSTSAPAAVSEANNMERPTLSANKASDNNQTVNNDDQANMEHAEAKQYPASEAYIIPLSDDSETKVYTVGAPEAADLLAATVKKQPPKRIQELIEQAAENESTTAEQLQDLEAKLEKAEERRKEYLQQKITNIQKTTQMLTPTTTTTTTRSDSKDNDGEEVKDDDGDDGSKGVKVEQK